MISSSWKFSMTPDPSLARISSRICSILGASPEPSVRWRGTRKSRMRRPSWYLTVRNARFRPNIPTVLWSALVAMKLTAGLRLDNIVWKRLSHRNSPSIRILWNIHNIHNIYCSCPIVLQWPRYISKFMGPTWGQPGSCRPQMGPMMAPGTLLSGDLVKSTTV